MKKSNDIAQAALAAALCAAAQAARADFSQDDVRFWVGEGTNAAVVVVDWDVAGAASSLAWGYRWNGAATAADATVAIVAADPRLSAEASTSAYGFFLSRFGYDRDGDGAVDSACGDFDSFGESFYEAGTTTGTQWSLSELRTGASFAAAGMGDAQAASVGASSLALADGGWFAWKFTYYAYDDAFTFWDGGEPAPAEPVSAEPPPFSFADIHYWVGEGTNETALVLDWNAPGAAPRAWGYRWNGAAPSFTKILRDVSHEDPRLHAFLSVSALGTSVDAFGYDRADAAAAFHEASATATDSLALFGTGADSHYWASSIGTGADFSSVAWSYAMSGADGMFPEDGQWIAFKHVSWATGEDSTPAARPVAAESPYGWRVVAADVASGSYGNPAAALGHPALTVPGWNSFPATPVVPFNPAWTGEQVVSLVSTNGTEDVGGSITIAFDHDVVDDEANPFGLDLIVFGNAFQTLGGSRSWSGTEDPATVATSVGEVAAEPGLVEVSADGETWFSFADGPFADDFAPTLARLYEPDAPDESLFEGNGWWGRTAHATQPVDPALSAASFKGLTLAQIARLYEGSAGGAGFDISRFDLPRDARGRKFIRYVRITTLSPGDSTEIDAVADVAPAPAFDNWVRAHFAAGARADVAPGTACANGLPAAVNAALGFAPDDAAASADFAVAAIEPRPDGSVRLTAPLAPHPGGSVRLGVAASPAGPFAPALPLWDGTNAAGRALLRAPASVLPAGPAAFFRLEIPVE